MAKRRKRKFLLSAKAWAIIVGALLVVGLLASPSKSSEPEISRSAVTAEPTAAPTARPTKAPTPTPDPVRSYVLNTNTMVFHLPSCSSVKDIAEKNRQDFEGTREDVTAMGYKACGRCHP